jgi:hypothetical protein
MAGDRADAGQDAELDGYKDGFAGGVLGFILKTKSAQKPFSIMPVSRLR